MDPGFSLRGYVYTAHGHPQQRVGTSELTLNILALLEEHCPGVGPPFSQEGNIIRLWRALTTAFPDTAQSWEAPHSTASCGLGTTHVSQHYPAMWLYQPALPGCGENEHIPDDSCGAPAFGWWAAHKARELVGLGRPNDPANSILIQLFRKQLPLVTERQRGAVHHAPG